MTPVEFNVFINLFRDKFEEISALKDFFNKAGFSEDEFVLLWDWTEDDVQIVPIGHVMENKK